MEKELNPIAPVEFLERWLPRGEALSRYYRSHAWQPQVRCTEKPAELGGKHGAGSQFLGSVPGVGAPRALPAPADAAPAAGRADEGRARALANHRLGNDTGDDVGSFFPLSPQEGSMKEKKLLLY